MMSAVIYVSQETVQRQAIDPRLVASDDTVMRESISFAVILDAFYRTV